jgi:hypothetical protein
MAMKKTSGGDSLSGRVPGRASEPCRYLGRRRRQIAMCSGKVIGSLDFFRRGVFIGEGTMSEVGLGGLMLGCCGLGPGHASPMCGAPVAPLILSFGSLEASR